MFILEL